ncbi:MAG: DUF3606 domain-containing protein [Aquabacterium sp.]|nr:MAG: DUF3606 domain-containing protein [Aquabacterium sp.]
MSDDFLDFEIRNRTLIDIQQLYELSYWAHRFNVSQRDLKDAVEAVGPEVAAVEAYFASMV